MTVEEFKALSQEEQEELREQADQEGPRVFILESWGGGEDRVVEHRDLFFVFSLNGRPPGPFRSLREAIVEGHLTDVTSAVVEIACEGMARENLLPLLRVHDDRVTTLLINGKEWSYDAKTGWLPEEDDDEDGEGPLFSCPFCGGKDDGCEDFLGSRDLNFCGGFCVDDAGRLCELNDSFDDLGGAVRALVAAGGKDPSAGLEPTRLREPVGAVAAGEDNSGFTDYVLRLGEDTGVAVAANSYEESGGPGFCSVVRMFWAEDVDAALDGMRRRVEQDVRRWRRHADSP